MEASLSNKSKIKCIYKRWYSSNTKFQNCSLYGLF